MAQRRRAYVWCALLSLVVASVGEPSLAQVLHDDQLEKTTADLLAAHKAADVPAAMQKALDDQTALDRSEIDALKTNEVANQERALAELLSADSRFLGMTRLTELVDNRIEWITGGSSLDPKVWLDHNEKVTDVKTLTDIQVRLLNQIVRRYEENGGHDFKDCDTFILAHSTDDPGSLAGNVVAQCKLVASARTPDLNFDRAIAALKQGGGDFQEVSFQLGAVQAKVQAEDADEARDSSELKKAKKALDDAVAAEQPKTVIADKLTELNNQLAQLDQAAGLIGSGVFKPGSALAAIKFRKTNLQEVLSTTGSSADTEAANLNRSVVGLIAGIIQYRDAGKVPSQAALAIALAQQTGLEAVASAQLDSLQSEADLLQEEQDAYIRELEYLAMARDAIGAVSPNAVCKHELISTIALAELIRDTACDRTVRESAARALAAYNMSWASGRTPARVLDRRISQEIYMRKLRVTNQVVRARYDVEQVALQELAEAGKVGIKTEEVAAVLQAIGIQAIAVGVNK